MVQITKKLWSVFFLSLLIPGLGHYRMGLIKKAFGFIGAGMGINVIRVALFFSPLREPIIGNILTLLLLVFILYAAVDAFLSSAKSEPSNRRGWPKVLVFCLIYFGAWLGLVVGIRTFVVQPFMIPSGTMAPTITEGDHFMANKLAYRSKDPQRGDVIVFVYPLDRKRTFVKRVVGLPGEKIGIKDGKIYVNGQPLAGQAVIDQIYYYNGGDYGAKDQTIQVPDGYYFVLGDHSIASHDSRYWGFVPRRDVIGRAFMIFDPPKRKGPIK